MITKEQVKLLKLAKGYKAGEPALVEFDTLVSLIEERDGLVEELSEVLEENQKLREQLKKERKANAAKERSYLEDLKTLETQLDKANKAAGNFFLADLQRKLKNKHDKKKAQRKKIFTKAELLLGDYQE